jgi:hypothetical protein
MKTGFNNWGFNLTEQLIEVCDQWLEFKGYECIEAYAEVEVIPYEDELDRLKHMLGEIGYEPYYLYEHIYYQHLKSLTITRANLLDFYFNTGCDQSQHSMRRDIGYEVVEALIEGKEYKLPTAESILDNCGYIYLKYCEEVIQGHPLEDYETEDIDFVVDIKLV